jgi:hypothetical protein
VKNKRFDCVRMKWDIQQQILKEFSGVPEAQAREIQMQQVMEDPILGPFCRDLIATKDSAGK